MTRVALKDGLLNTIHDPEAARLLGGQCTACTQFHFPAQSICPYCSSDGCATVPLSPRGVIEVCTTVVNRPPGYEGIMPFGFGVVELPEGIRLISRIGNPEHARPGQPVRFVLDQLCIDTEGREVVTYAFEAVHPPDPKRG